MSHFLSFENVGWAMRLLLAQGVVALFLLLNVVSFSMPHAGDFKPFFLLMAVYYWAIYRPTVMPVGYTFVLGLIMDLEGGLPIGLNALVLIGLQDLVRRSRLFLMGQPYAMVWLGFGIVAVGYALALWLVISFFSFNFAQFSSLTSSIIAAGLSILLFPAASLLLLGVHKILPVSSKPLHSVV